MTAPLRMTAKELQAYLRGDKGLPGVDGGPKAQPSKYRNVKTPFVSIQGFELTAASKREAKMYADLDQLIVAREVLHWVPQVGFLLQGGSRYVCDALVFWRVGHVTIWDAKGKETAAFKIKRGLMLSTYNLHVEIV